MRAFIIFCCIAYVAGDGYNYQTPIVNTNYLPPGFVQVGGSPGGGGAPGQGYSYQTPPVNTNYLPPGGGAQGGGAPGGGTQGGGAQGGVSQGGGGQGGGGQGGGGQGGGGQGGGGQGGGGYGGGGQGGGAQGGTAQGGGGQSSGGPGQGYNYQTPHNGGGSSSGGGNQGGHFSGQQGGQWQRKVPIEYTKEFFTYRVDDHEYLNVNQLAQNSGTVKKNIRVVIIKGPEVSGLEDAAVALNKNVNEQQLAIYVLSKQADINELTSKLSSGNLQTGPKPEVHYVKYKTDDDAEKAKQAIHQQYESLAGPSSSLDGGSVPVHSYSSQAAQPEAPAAPAPAPASGYLPSNVLK